LLRALRSVGKRSALCHAQAIALAELLAARQQPSARWIGKVALRELKSPAQVARVGRKVPGQDDCRRLRYA
jgi:hypothetical protein